MFTEQQIREKIDSLISGFKTLCMYYSDELFRATPNKWITLIITSLRSKRTPDEYGASTEDKISLMCISFL